ncbi:MAG: transcriptional regulator, partial [Sphingomonas sp.]
VHGLLELEFSAFAVDGRPELGMIVYNPATPETAHRIRALMTPTA